MAYNFTLLQNATSPAEIAVVANTFTGGALGIAMLVLIGSAVFFFLRSAGYERTREAVSASFFIVFLSSTIMRVIGLVDNYVWGGCFVLAILAVVMLINRE